MATKKRPIRKFPRLRGRVKDLTSQYIAEEHETGKYSRVQAIAVGISRAVEQAKKETQQSKINAMMKKYRVR